MVMMFVDCCVGGGLYFPYYSYRRNHTGREFFILAGSLIGVKLLTAIGPCMAHRFSWASFKLNNFLNFRQFATFDSSKCS